MSTVSLALMWHQHQPYYPDDVGGENPMPWVRLHGTKDYIGMALHLEEVPEFRCTINLVPSLLLQIEAYVQGATDKHLRVSRLPADGLSHEDALYLLDNFFMAYADAMIRPHPRYHELYNQRGLGVDSAEQALPRFRERDLRDLQVWSNLSWMHPILFEKDRELAEFKAKGRRYTEDEKQWLLDKQRELLAQHGIEWIATDEEILGCSTHGKVGRDSRGHVRHPELLYRAWKVAEAGHELGIVFRDHSMSDQVGFHYQRSPGPAAAGDFLGKLHAIGDACRYNPATIVPVILDGENCWEYYPDGGVSFLRSLYQGAVRDPRVKPVTIGEFLRDHPPADTLNRLFSGSWISHNFAIWIGHPEDNRAWDALHKTRQFLVREAADGR